MSMMNEIVFEPSLKPSCLASCLKDWSPPSLFRAQGQRADPLCITEKNEQLLNLFYSFSQFKFSLQTKTVSIRTLNITHKFE
jgi:hypothetical protein